MSDVRTKPMTRRSAILGGALAVAGIAAGTTMVGAAPAVQSGGGIAGGGTIKSGDQVATFSVFASRFAVVDQTDPILFGRVQWADATGFVFESSTISNYGPTEGNDAARIIEGTAKLSTGEEVPFTLIVRDTKSPGAGNDELKLTTQLADGTAYEVDGSLGTGDLQLLTFAFPE